VTCQGVAKRDDQLVVRARVTESAREAHEGFGIRVDRLDRLVAFDPETSLDVAEKRVAGAQPLAVSGLEYAGRDERVERFARALDAEARLGMPVQLLWGADDPTFPVALARAMVSQLPNARMTEIPGAKLLVHEEKPAEVAEAALAFLG